MSRERGELASVLAQRLSEGRYSQGLPGAEALAKRYHVDIGDANITLRELAAGGWIRRGDHKIAFDPEENFNGWKNVVGLPESFPSLSPLSRADLGRMVTSLSQSAAINEIEGSVIHPFKRVVNVEITPGHGGTTLFRRVSEMARRNAGPYGLLPVRLSWSRLGESEVMANKLDNAAREDIIRGIVSSTFLRDEDTLELFDAEDEFSLNQQKSRIIAALGFENLDSHEIVDSIVDWARLKEIAPLLAGTPMPELITILGERLSVKPVLLFDLSKGLLDRGEVEKRRDNLVGVVKDLEEATASFGATFKEVYFADRDLLDMMRGVYQRGAENIVYPSCNMIQIYAILHLHTPALWSDFVRFQGVASIDSVVSSSLFEEIRVELHKRGLGFKNVGLVDVIEMLRAKILSRMRKPWAEISPHLE